MTDSPYPLTRATIERAREALMTRHVQERKNARIYDHDQAHVIFWGKEADDTQRAIDALSQLIAEGMYRDE